METESTDCGTHEFCNVTSAGRTCDCVAGYTDGVSGCVWTGTIQDPAFATSTGWTPVNGALLNTTAAGGLDPGEVSFVASALCGLGYVEQTFDMPPFEKAEPLVLELSYKNQIDFMNFDSVYTGVSFGGRWTALPYFNDAAFHTARICLGSAAYAASGTSGRGAPVTLALGPYLEPDGCPSTTITNFAIDRAAIVVANAGECGTEPGRGPNHDAEGADGWTFQRAGNGSSSAGFASGAGAGGTRGARLLLNQRCDSVSMATSLNVLDTANPALEMYVASSAGSNPSATLSTNAGLRLVSGTSGTVRACLSPAHRGTTLPISFRLSGGSGVCADVLNHSLVVDNVQVVDDPACASSEYLANPGFEHPGNTFDWTAATTSTVVVRQGAAQAHGGSRYLAMDATARCASASARFSFVVPPPAGAQGPAVTLWANVGVNPDASTSIFVNEHNSMPLPEGGGYQKATYCLNPKYAGRTLTLSLSHYGGSGACNNQNYGTQSAAFDDVEVTTDASCPAQ